MSRVFSVLSRPLRISSLLAWLLCGGAHDRAFAGPVPEAAEKLKKQGDDFAGQERYDDALRAYKDAVAAAPKYHLAFEGLGRVYFARGLYGPAIENFQKALLAEPTYDYGHYNLAYAYRKAGKFREAVASYEAYIKRKSDDPDAFYGLAESYKALGELEKAIANFEAYGQKEKRDSEKQWVEAAT